MEQIKEQLTDIKSMNMDELTEFIICLLYTSDAADD